MTTWITVCDTCKRPEKVRDSDRTDGAALASLIETAAAEADAAVRVRRFSCLMGCVRACNVTIQAPGKLCYTLAEFAPDQQAAAAILDFAVKHAASDKGQVPYRTWPDGVKGHFASRHIPLPDA